MYLMLIWTRWLENLNKLLFVYVHITITENKNVVNTFPFPFEI